VENEYFGLSTELPGQFASAMVFGRKKGKIQFDSIKIEHTRVYAIYSYAIEAARQHECHVDGNARQTRIHLRYENNFECETQTFGHDKVLVELICSKLLCDNQRSHVVVFLEYAVEYLVEILVQEQALIATHHDNNERNGYEKLICFEVEQSHEAVHGRIGEDDLRETHKWQIEAHAEQH
jgi:hypothetical protein